MVKQTKNVGDETEQFCPKCDIERICIISAMVEGHVKKVQCGFCRHTFSVRKKKAGPASKAGKTRRRVRKTVKSGEMAAFMARLEDREFLAREAKNYTLDGQYKEGDWINHGRYGYGQVEKLYPPRKMAVLFRDGEKNLVYGYEKSSGDDTPD
jgi:hypothetical protein